MKSPADLLLDDPGLTHSAPECRRLQVADRVDALVPTRGRNRRIVFAAGAGVLQRIVQAGGMLLVAPLVLKTLGASGFGLWGAAVSLVALISLLDLGLGAALVTMVAEATARSTANDARRHVTGALVSGCGLAVLTLIVASAIVLIAVPQAQVDLYLIAVVGLAVNVPLNGANCVWMALQKGYVSSFWEFIQTLSVIGGLIAATWFTVDVRVYVAVVYGGYALGNLGSLCHLFVQHPELRPDLSAGWLASARSVSGKGVLYFAMGLTGGLTYLLDCVLALQLLGADAAARMTIASRICLGAGGVLTILSQPFWPAFSEAAVRRDLPWIRRGLVRGTAVMIGVAVAASAVLVTVGGPFLRWWLRTDLGIDRGLLWAMAAWIIIQAVGRVPCFLLNGVGVVRFQVGMCAVATSAALCLKFLWAPRFGVEGILWATTIPALLVNAPALAWRSRLWLKSCSRPSAEQIGDVC
jgi:O-antigen/teichoic acid export membrane protein